MTVILSYRHSLFPYFGRYLTTISPNKMDRRPSPRIVDPQHPPPTKAQPGGKMLLAALKGDAQAQDIIAPT